MNQDPLQTPPPPYPDYPPPPVPPTYDLAIPPAPVYPDYVSPPPPPPPPPRPRRRGRWRGCLSGCCSASFTFLMLFTCSIALWLGFYAANPPETANILILGSDARPGSAEAEIARTDSIMVLGLNPQKQQVSLLSVPRDLFLTTPNYGLLRANTVLRNAELNFVGSGLEEMQGAIEETFEIEVDYYLRVNFEGFIAVVDALGGVTIEVPKHIIDYEYPTADYGTMVVEFQAGRQKMDGERALIYARTRHGDDDYQRAARQQQVMAALMSELTNPFNLPRWPAVVAAILDNSETNLTARQLFDLAPAILLYGNRPGLIEQLVIDRDYVTYGPNGEAIPHGPSLQPWVEAHLQ